METIMASIAPQWCEQIINGKKHIEARKTVPSSGVPFRCLIYCTTGGKTLNIPISRERLMQDFLDTGSMACLNCPIGNGKVIGEFICDAVRQFPYAEIPTGRQMLNMPEDDEALLETETVYLITTAELEETCLSYEQLEAYGKGKLIYGWHISDLVVYEKPMELAEFSQSRPPQSWCYIK